MTNQTSLTPPSLLRPSKPWSPGNGELWQYRSAIVLAAVGIAVIAVVTAFSVPLADWVGDLTDPGKQSIAESRAGRVETYQAWLLPAFFAGLAIVLAGISIALWGVVTSIWIRGQVLAETLPVLSGGRED
ncbi:MAG: hypothetical protein J4N36_01710 [Chloroflexi bacterium]|nr:hypothetical protein [Chloroflexota bacterium]MCI0831927.1 hypothetical protein [Chloroflexota bacterium]MCI0838452.1 hypothetical protein [Chloroflexota bacterium]MCI0842456.1 hypothetical protein [Chloroflexota bacterium]MCI0885260.1 hypothetical protein [Chloroflexota bacterium]